MVPLLKALLQAHYVVESFEILMTDSQMVTGFSDLKIIQLNENLLKM